MKSVTIDCGCGEDFCHIHFVIQKDGDEYLAYIDGGEETAEIYFTKRKLVELRHKINSLIGDKNEDS